MPREKESYRDNLELLQIAFPNKNMLYCNEVARWMGKDRRFVKKEFFKDKKLMSIAELARKIS